MLSTASCSAESRIVASTDTPARMASSRKTEVRSEFLIDTLREICGRLRAMTPSLHQWLAIGRSGAHGLAPFPSKPRSNYTRGRIAIGLRRLRRAPGGGTNGAAG
jgi:hypothetical protein